MPIPSKKKGEDKNAFMQRCMGNEKMQKEYPDNQQRVAICMSKAVEDLSYVEAMDFQLSYAKNQQEMEDEEDDEDEEEETEAKFKYRHPDTNELYYYQRKGIYQKDGKTLVFMGKDKE